MTPEPKYRTFWPRFWAAIVDTLVFVPLALGNYWFWDIHAPIWVNLAWYVMATFAFLAYSIILHARFGQTLGKRLCRVRVVDTSERPLTWVQAVLRDLPNMVYPLWGSVAAVSLILAGQSPYPDVEAVSEADRQAEFLLNMWLFLELLTTLTNSKRRSIHDLLARSVVVRIDKPQSS